MFDYGLLKTKYAYLWTNGYIPKLKTQEGLEIPKPLLIKIVKGKGDIETVCKDILALTKLNYNSCIYGIKFKHQKINVSLKRRLFQ